MHHSKLTTGLCLKHTHGMKLSTICRVLHAGGEYNV